VPKSQVGKEVGSKVLPGAAATRPAIRGK
jgi:hypothetical protein